MLLDNNIEISQSAQEKFVLQQQRVGMGEQEDPFTSVYDVLDYLPDFDSLSDPLCCPIRFPADNCRLIPVDDVIFCVDMVCDRGFVLLWLWLFPGASDVFLTFM